MKNLIQVQYVKKCENVTTEKIRFDVCETYLLQSVRSMTKMP